MSYTFGTRSALHRFLAFLDIRSRPDRVECLVKPEPRINVAGKFIRFRNDRFKRRANKCVSMSLATCQRTRIAAKERQMRSKFLAEGHR